MKLMPHVLQQAGEARRDDAGFVVGTTVAPDGRMMGTIVPATIMSHFTFRYHEGAPLKQARGFHDAAAALAFFKAQYTPGGARAPPPADVDRREAQRQKRLRLARATAEKKRRALQEPDTCTCADPACGCFDRWHAALNRDFDVPSAEFSHRVQGEIAWRAFRRERDGFAVGPLPVKVTWKRAGDSVRVAWRRREAKTAT